MEQRAVIYTKFGLFELTGSEKGIATVHRLDYEESITEDLPKVLRKCAQQLNAYFAGKRTSFDLKLIISRTVLAKLAYESSSLMIFLYESLPFTE